MSGEKQRLNTERYHPSQNLAVMARAIKVLRREGIRLSHKWRGDRFVIGTFEEDRSERQEKISRLLCTSFKTKAGEEIPTLWTTEDLALALGLDASNKRLLGEIGRDCSALGASQRQVKGLVGSRRLRVHSFDNIDGLSLAEVRDFYALVWKRYAPFTLFRP